MRCNGLRVLITESRAREHEQGLRLEVGATGCTRDLHRLLRPLLRDVVVALPEGERSGGRKSLCAECGRLVAGFIQEPLEPASSSVQPAAGEPEPLQQ